MGHYKDEAEIAAVIQGFESCATGKDSFSHADHLAVAVTYLRGRGEEQALTSMREGLMRFLNHHGIGADVYNETITRFWVTMVARRMRELSSASSFTELTNSVVETFSDSQLVFEYYSKELANSPVAKTRWVQPDLKALD